MANKSENKNKWLSAIITLLLGIGIVELLMLTSMKYDRLAENEETKLLQDSIIFGGEEYVALGDFLEATSDEMAPNGDENLQSEAQGEEDPQLTGQNDLTNQGAVDEPPKQQVTSTKESSMKVTYIDPEMLSHFNTAAQTQVQVERSTGSRAQSIVLVHVVALGSIVVTVYDVVHESQLQGRAEKTIHGEIGQDFVLVPHVERHVERNLTGTPIAENHIFKLGFSTQDREVKAGVGIEAVHQILQVEMITGTHKKTTLGRRSVQRIGRFKSMHITAFSNQLSLGLQPQKQGGDNQKNFFHCI